MKMLLQFQAKRKLREALLLAETEARLRGPCPKGDDPELVTHSGAGSVMTESEEIRYRRLMAMLHYGEATATPEYEALLTEGEREYLDAYLIQQRWAVLWLERHRAKNRESRFEGEDV